MRKYRIEEILLILKIKIGSPRLEISIKRFIEFY